MAVPRTTWHGPLRPGAYLVTFTEMTVENALYLPDLATDTRTLQVPAVVGATRRPVLMRHLPEVTLYVRLPFDTVFTTRVSSVRLRTFTDFTDCVKPATAVTLSDDPLTAPAAFLTEMRNV